MTSPTPDWARLWVEHETLYRYSIPVENALHVACLRPLNDQAQRLRVLRQRVTPESQP